MPEPTIKIKDILIQGCMGQKIVNHYPSHVCDIKEVSSLPSAREIDSLSSSRYLLVNSAGNLGFYFYNKSTNSLQKIAVSENSLFNLQLYFRQHPQVLNTHMSSDTLKLVQSQTGHSIDVVEQQVTPVVDPETQTPEQLFKSYGAGYSLVDYADTKYLVNPATTPPAVLYSRNTFIKNRLTDILELIDSIKAHALAAQEDPEMITRVISDEFTFYPADKPYTLTEYKAIINKVAEATSSLPANIHIVFATFPVAWTDGKLRNCGLYAASPLTKDSAPRVYHFAKKKPFKDDPNYLQDDGTSYVYNSQEDNANPDYLPDRVLENTAVQINDVNQYQAAFKVAGAAGQDLLVSVGICFDHSTGMERNDVHCLTEQLQAAGHDVPLHCSHVITSYSISQYKQHTVSTISHADPLSRNRRPLGDEILGRNGFIEASLQSCFSGALHSEHYPSKAIGIVHSDMFQHNISCKSSNEVIEFLNQQDADGNTLLHKVFLETNYDGELIAKRLYFLILHGGDPHIENLDGRSVIELAHDLSIVSSLIVIKAINSSLQWRAEYAEQNTVSEIDGHTKLTRLIATEGVNTNLADYILAGANPYVKNAHGKSAMDMLTEHPDIEERKFILEVINGTMLKVQNGYQRSGVRYYTDSDESFPPYIPQNIRAIDRPQITEFIHEFSSLYQRNESVVDVLMLTKMREKIALLQNMMTGSIDVDSVKLDYDALGYQLSILGISLPARDNTLSFLDLVKNLKVAMQTALFVKFKETFAKTIQQAHDLSVFETLSSTARAELFDLISPDFAGILQNIASFDFLRFLSPENTSEVFKYIAPNLAEYSNLDSQLGLTVYLKYFTTALQIVIVDELIAKIEANTIAAQNFDFTFLCGCSKDLVERVLNAIPQGLWSEIGKHQDLLKIIKDNQNSPQVFLCVFAKISEELLNSVKRERLGFQNVILQQLSELPAEYLQTIQTAVLPALQQFNSRVLQESPGELKIIISKIFAPDNYPELQKFLENLDETQQQYITSSIKDELSEIFPSISSQCGLSSK